MLGIVAAAFALLLAVTGAIGPWAAGPANAASDTILGTAAPAKLAKHTDNTGVEVGTKFSVLADGSATGIRFWKDQASGVRTGTLWTSQGKKLAQVSFTGQSSSGWQTADFNKAVALKAGQSYVVSYFAPKGGYAATYDYTAKSQSSHLKISKGAGVFKYGSTSRFPTETYRNSSYWVDIVFTAGSATAPKPPKPTPVPPTDPTPPTTNPVPPTESKPDPAPNPDPTPTPPPTTPSTGFPSAANTGVPAGTALSAYTGSCTITTAGTVIDAKQIKCAPLHIKAPGVVITRSIINGTVYADDQGTSSFSISDSEVIIGAQMGTGIGDARFTATRVEVTGGNRSVNCFKDCTITDSYVHGQFRDASGVAHESGVRMGSGSVIRGNTIACDAPDVAPDAGCSAALTGYGDFAVVQNNTIDGNLFVGGSGGYCSYGGSTSGKPFSAGVKDIRFTNNVWQRGSSGKCGAFGPITSFDSNAPGNVWSNNTWEDGTVIRAAN